ncbi:MAG: histidine--tRNA ligase [Nitrospira sp.]|nr:histidine--tRNA ligase [bacterium]MBL7049059.1 histidine--tRNA ligase [Nitrospira sp.]
MKHKTLKGLQDIMPPEIAIWQHVEKMAHEVFRNFGCREIRLPIIESTDVFIRSIGETSDIVEKEMYTFEDKGGRSVTMRPEGTAAFVRAYVQHHLHNDPAPQKYFYMGPMFRYERPQAFRYRQFYQIGVEAMGIEDPKLDAEMLSMLSVLLDRIGLKGLNFEVTSIGCKDCRPGHREALTDFLRDKLDAFCTDCQRRFDLNPLRILDCKVNRCIESREGAPPVIEHLCDDCSTHFNALKNNLKILNVPHTINPNLVRGLDYYTKTAFEVTSENLGSQSAVAAGGRYDSMVKDFGGPPTPGIGFAMGMERIIPLIKDAMAEPEGPDLYICPIGDAAIEKSFTLTNELRAAGLWAETAYQSTSLKSQMRKANRIGAKHVIVIGEDEIGNNAVTIKNMANKEESSSTLTAADICRIISP